MTHSVILNPRPLLRSFSSPSRRKLASLDRVFPGPKFSYSLGTRPGRRRPDREYYIAFREKQEGIINSAKVWKSYKEGRGGVDYRMLNWIQILSTPTADTTGTTLFLHFDHKRYIIGNVGEGTQRAAMQRKLALMKVGDIFLTGAVNWANTGGLMGMVLTLADVVTNSANAMKDMEEARRQRLEQRGLEYKPHDSVLDERQWLNIHGGKNLTHLIATTRRFVFRTGMPINTNEFRAKPEEKSKDISKPTWEDTMVKVWAMVIEPENHVEPENHRVRKRSHEEFAADALSVSMDGLPETPEEQEDRYDQMRKAVVSHMFDSDWKLDTLIKVRLSKVKMPSKIFYRNADGKIAPYEGPTMAEDPSTPDIDVLIRNPWPASTIDSLPPTTPSANSVCYIIKNHPQRGKFNPKVAESLGVPRGKLNSELARGRSITLEDGTVITPEQVLAPGKPGGGVAVIELPTEAYIGALLARKEWSSQEVMLGVEAVIWILGPGLTGDTRLLNFMREHAELKHIVSSKDCCANYLALESSASAAIKLHLIDPERFPIPKYSNSIPPPKSEGPLPFEPARVFKKIHLEPKFFVQDDQIIPYLNTKAVCELPENVDALAKGAREEISHADYLAELDENQKDIPNKDAEVITLGTGSALPSKYRNVSATLLRVPGVGSYLFDCGENTLGQLRRVFGGELPEVLRDLKTIWISHLHADHHLGTTSVVKAWADETAKDETTKANKLVVASDEAMHKWMKEYADIEDYGFDRVWPISLSKDTTLLCQFSPEMRLKYGLVSIEACPVVHCNAALAVAFNFPNRFKIAYSGDCRPSTEFARIGRGATLLIHEATFDDELIGDARAKRHSTTSEALQVGRNMGARRILLTHFSQRYQKFPVTESHKGKDQVAVLGFDYMRCKIGDFAKLESFKPALMKYYEKAAEEQ